MRLPDSTSLTNAVWSSYSEWAIWQSPWYEMRLSAPAVLLPEDSPDGLWHLFAHSWMGIEHYSSPSGFDWSADTSDFESFDYDVFEEIYLYEE